MNKKFENLEKKFNVATSLIEELTGELEITNIQVENKQQIQTIDETKEIEVFQVEMLKTDFMLVRNSILKLVNTGQRVLDSVSVLDISDLKASQLQAIAELSKNIGTQLKDLVDIYKTICEIEKLKTKEKILPQNTQSNVNTGTINNNNIYAVSSMELLELLKK